MPQNDTPTPKATPAKSRSRGIGRRESMAGGLGILAALGAEALGGTAAAQGSAESLRRGGPVPGPKGKGQTQFAAVIQRALADPAYAEELQTLAIQTRQGNPTAANQLMGVFKLTPSDVKTLNAQITYNPKIMPTTLPCVSVGVTLTLLFSC